MYSLAITDNIKQEFNNGYDGNIDSSVLLSENEDIIYKCICYEIKDGTIFWERLILTNKKIIRLLTNQVYYTYLKSIDTIDLVRIHEDNVIEYEYELRGCLDNGDEPYYLFLNGSSILINGEADAMALLDEINRLICE